MNEHNIFRRQFFFSDDLNIIDVLEYIVFNSDTAVPIEYKLFDC